MDEKRIRFSLDEAQGIMGGMDLYQIQVRKEARSGQIHCGPEGHISIRERC